MTLHVLVADLPQSVDAALVNALLTRWGEAEGIDVVSEVVAPGAYGAARAAAESSARGLLIDVELARAEPPIDRTGAAAVVYVDLSIDGWHGAQLDGRVLFGRGVDTYVWAAHHLAAHLRWEAEAISYGSHRDQFAELRVPGGPGPHPVVVLVHGGFWRAHWELDLMDRLAIDLAEAGWATWNVEYRKGPGSWRAALDDVATAIDHLAVIADDHRLAIERTALVGHSAGGHLVLWAAARRRHGPAGDSTVDPAVVVPLAPVSDLVDCARRGLGDRAAQAFFGADPAGDPEAYRLADPMQRLPVGIPTTIVQGLSDGADLIDHNRRFVAAAARAGERVELLELDGTDHFHVIDPATAAWAEVRAAIGRHLPAGTVGA
jgi:acetyl esterase/lipase